VKGRAPTKEEKEYMNKVGELGCIVCRLFYGINDSPASIHHCEGRTKKGAHFKILPLCARHHQMPSNTGEWATRHAYMSGPKAGKKAFEEEYLTERELMEIVERMVNDSRL